MLLPNLRAKLLQGSITSMFLSRKLLFQKLSSLPSPCEGLSSENHPHPLKAFFVIQ
jgi:hypothetical protein